MGRRRNASSNFTTPSVPVKYSGTTKETSGAWELMSSMGTSLEEGADALACRPDRLFWQIRMQGQTENFRHQRVGVREGRRAARHVVIGGLLVHRGRIVHG